MHPLLWLMGSNYRNVLSKRLRTLRSPGRFLALVLIVAGLLLLARQREAAEKLVERSMRPTLGQNAAHAPRTAAGTAPPPSPVLAALGTVRDDPEAIALAMALVIATFMSVTWLNPVRENPLELTEAESATLVPAPLRRWEIVVYKVARWQIPLLFHSTVLTLVLAGPNDLGGGLRRSLAFWILMATWRTQRGFVAIVRATLEAIRLSVVVRVGAAFAIGLVVAVLWVNRGPELDGDRVLTVLTALPQLAQNDTLRLLLWPALALTRPIAHSGDTESWFATLPAAFAVLVLVIALVVLADAGFQRATAGDRTRQEDVHREARTPFPLTPTGHPAFALTYRQLAPHLRWSSLGTPIGVVVGVSFAGWLLPEVGLADPSLLLSALVVSLTFFFVLPLAPLFVRLDIRREMERIDVLRGLPLPPGQVLAALGAAEWLACLAVQGGALLIFATNMLGRGTPPAQWVPWIERVAPFWPAVTLLGVCLCQLGALTFPTWVAPSNPRGPRIDAVGGRLLTLLGFGGGLFALGLLPLSAASVAAAFAGDGSTRGPLARAATVVAFYIVAIAEAIVLHAWAVRTYEQLAAHDPARGN